MKRLTFIPALLFAALLFVAGCSGPQEEEKQGEAPKEDAAGETTASTAGGTTGGATNGRTTGSQEADTSTLTIFNSLGAPVEVEVEVSDETDEQTQGLSGRTALAEDAGMLFAFETEQARAFQMRDTRIPLSIAHINAQGVIVDIQDMEPLAQQTYPAAAPARYALEVNQGFFAENGIEVGNVVQLPAELADASAPVSSAAVVDAFRAAGLEVGESYPVDEEPGWSERPVPRTYEEATRFEIPFLGEDSGGRVFVFGSEADLDEVREYYEGLENTVRPYILVEGNVLVQISRELPNSEAQRYEAALAELVAAANTQPNAAPPTAAPPVESPPSEAVPAEPPPDAAPAG